MFEIAPLEKTMTIEEYLDWELEAETKHEFHNGIIIEMSGALAPHNLVKAQLFGLLFNFCKSRKHFFFAWDSDHRVRIEAFNKFVYPDAMINAGKPEFYVAPSGNLRTEAILNPVLIVEVLSKSTRKRDKTTKFEWYKTLPTFREYLLIEPEFVSVEVRRLKNGTWKEEHIEQLSDLVWLESLGLALPVGEIYETVLALGMVKI